MNRNRATRHLRRRRSFLVGAIALAALALPGARAARAELSLPHELHREVRSHVHDVLRSIGRIPAEIHRDHRRHLEVFLGGNVYYAPHRHHHATYNFPVSVDGGIYYRPYTYCNGRLYGSHASRPQFWSGWGVPSQGHWCSSHRSYYPTGHSCFQRQSRTHDRDRYDAYRGGYRSEAYYHGGRSYRSERFDRSERGHRSERSYRSERSPRSERSYRSDRRDRSDRDGRRHRHDSSCRHDRHGRH